MINAQYINYKKMNYPPELRFVEIGDGLVIDLKEYVQLQNWWSLKKKTNIFPKRWKIEETDWIRKIEWKSILILRSSLKG